MTENDGLTFPPILEMNLDPVLCRYGVHNFIPFWSCLDFGRDDSPSEARTGIEVPIMITAAMMSMRKNNVDTFGLSQRRRLVNLKDTNPRKVIYREKVWVHREDLSKFGNLRPMLVPFNFK